MPVPVGLKVTLIAQLAPALKVFPQWFVWAKSPFEVKMPETAILPLVVLFKVTVRGELVTPTS